MTDKIASLPSTYLPLFSRIIRPSPTRLRYVADDTFSVLHHAYLNITDPSNNIQVSCSHHADPIGSKGQLYIVSQRASKMRLHRCCSPPGWLSVVAFLLWSSNTGSPPANNGFLVSGFVLDPASLATRKSSFQSISSRSKIVQEQKQSVLTYYHSHQHARFRRRQKRLTTKVNGNEDSVSGVQSSPVECSLWCLALDLGLPRP